MAAKKAALRDTGLMRCHTKTSLRDREPAVKVCIMKVCVLLKTLFETIADAKGNPNGIVQKLCMRFPFLGG